MSPRYNRAIARIRRSLVSSFVLFAHCISFAWAQSAPQPGSAPVKASAPESALTPAPAPSATPPQPTSELPKIGENKLQQIVERASESEGAIFVDQDKVHVQAPLLTALIELHRDLSPYGVDAAGARSVKLRDVLTQALAKNLALDISTSDMQSSKWLFRSQLGGFLPTLENQINYQAIKGQFASPFGAKASINSPYLTIPNGLVWNFFDGGATIFGSLKAKHQYKAAKYDVQRTTNDVLCETAKLYYNLVLQNVILQVRIKAVETSEALVEKNQVQFQYGANTQLDLLQAQTQLARDRQALIAQQIARRKAAVELATFINLTSADDLTVADHLVAPVRLVDDKIKIANLVQMAIDSRPELKKWEEERLAAKDAIRLAYAPLLPTVTGAAGLAATGAKVSPSTLSTSGASAPATGGFGAGQFGTASLVPLNGTALPPHFSMAEIYLIGIGVQWNIGGLGLTDTAKIQSAKWLARKTQSEFALELTRICKQVRDAYLDSIDYENQIAATTAEVNSARQQLNVAVIRLEEAVGTDLDVVNAQRDYTNALISKASAIVQFNQAQAQLLRAIGRVSVENLTANKGLPQ